MNIKYEIIHSKRKTLSLTINRQGVLTVRAPKYVTDSQIAYFVEQNRDWVIRNIQKRENSAIVYPKIKGIDGEKLFFLGTEITLKIADVKHTDLVDKVLYVPKDKNIIDEIVKWYKARAKNALTKLTEEYAKVLGYRFSGVRITSARTRFGSCNSKNSINYSYKLMMYDAECIKYVVVHELCHTVHKNHSEKYWSAVARAVPDYRRIRKKMQDTSAMMDMI